MQVSKYLYKHFAQLNCHNLNYGVKITSAVLLQYVKALGFKVLTLKFYGKPISQKKYPLLQGAKLLYIKSYMYRYKVNLQCHIYQRYN